MPSDASLPSGMNRADLLLDTELCAALGAFPDSGCCVRHPGVCVISRTGDMVVKTCPACESEFFPGGRRQRRSFASAIMQVQKIHHDGEGWANFKRKWDLGSMISMKSAETKDPEDDIDFQVGEEHSQNPRRLDLRSPSSILRRTSKHQVAWKEYTWQVILRTTQVQEWVIADKDKEIEILKAKLESLASAGAADSLTGAEFSVDPPESMDTHATSVHGSNEPTALRSAGTEKSAPRQSHRNASPRHRSHKFAAEYQDTGRADTHVDEISKDASADSSSTDLKTSSAHSSDRKVSAPPRLPQRQRSEELTLPFPGSDDSDSSDDDVGTISSNRGIGRLSPRPSKHQARVPPTLPIRQASSKELKLSLSEDPRISNVSSMSGLTNSTFASRGRYDSDSNYGSVSRHSDRRSFATTTDGSRSRYSKASSPGDLKNHLETIEALDRESSHSTKDHDFRLQGEFTPSAENRRKQSSVVPPPPFDEHPSPEEKSFPPPVMAKEDQSVPPPPPNREDSLSVGDGMNGDIQFDLSQEFPSNVSQQGLQQSQGSQDIQFDASQDIRFDASDSSSKRKSSSSIFHRSSIAHMEFSDKDRLMREASEAFSSPEYVSRKITNFHKLMNVGGGAGAGVPSKKAPPPSQPPPEDTEDTERSVASPTGTPPAEMDGFPDLPFQSGFVRVEQGSLSPVSCVTMLTEHTMSIVGVPLADDDEDEELEPNIGLSDRGRKKLLPMEEGFNSEEESSEDDDDDESIVPTIDVVDQIVNDKYGDSGLYTGSVTTEGRIPHGRGVMMYENEREYNGDWSDGRWHGQGEWVNPNGDRYNGTFVFDSRHGNGTYSWGNGNLYRGEFFEDKRQGKGDFTFANGNVYEGEFTNGVFEGEGKYTFANGFYRGSWKGGKYHGIGFLQFEDESSYSGTFVEGVAHGEGKQISSSGKVTTGFWHQGFLPTEDG